MADRRQEAISRFNEYFGEEAGELLRDVLSTHGIATSRPTSHSDGLGEFPQDDAKLSPSLGDLAGEPPRGVVGGPPGQSQPSQNEIEQDAILAKLLAGDRVGAEQMRQRRDAGDMFIAHGDRRVGVS